MEMKIVFPGGKKADALYKGFTIQTDQSKDNGGEGSAPSPFDLFLASLGTCAGVYVSSFCQKRGISSDNISLLMRTEKDDETHLIKKINIDIKLPNDFPDNYKQAVISTAGLCTVKKQMATPPEFEINTV
ncbi:MAG: OsmC family protein [Spirochaetes bacterium]|nr:OsmC family protein [Spirochaetota bacterium]